MKKHLLFLPIAMSLFSFLSKPQKVVFFGDSITEAAVHAGGYLVKMQEMLAAQNRTADFELFGAGIGGNKIYDLYLRLENDVLDKKPNMVVVFVGVNDVWHKRTHGTGTDSWKFVQFYEALIQKLQKENIKVILATPACIGERTDFSNELDGDLNFYSNLIRQLAIKYNCKLADLRKVFLEYNLANNPENREKGILTTDGVHLNEAGNLLVAKTFLEKINN